jgi:hypothetical protein
MYLEILKQMPGVVGVLSCDDKSANIRVNVLDVRDLDELDTPFKNQRGDYVRSIDYTISMLDEGFLPSKALETMLVTNPELLRSTYYKQEAFLALISAHTRLRAALQRAAYLYLVTADKAGSADRVAVVKKIYEQFTAQKDLDGLRALAAKCPDQSALVVPATVLFNKTGEWVANYYMVSNDQEPFNNLELAKSLVQLLNSTTKDFDTVLRDFVSKGHYMTGPAGGQIKIDNRDKALKLLNFTTSSPKFQAALVSATPDQAKMLHRIVDHIARRFPTRHLAWTVQAEGDLQQLQRQKEVQRLPDDIAIVCEKRNIPGVILSAITPYKFSFTTTDKAVMLVSNSQQQHEATAEEDRLLTMALRQGHMFNKEMNRLEAAANGVVKNAEEEDEDEAGEKKAAPVEKKVLFSAGTTAAKVAPTRIIPPPSKENNKYTELLKQSTASASPAAKTAAQPTASAGAGVQSTHMRVPTIDSVIPQMWIMYQRWSARTGCHIGPVTEVNEYGRLHRIGMDDIHQMLPGNCDPLGMLSNLEELDDINLPFPNSTKPDDLVADLAELIAIYTALILCAELAREIVGKPFAEDAAWIPDTSKLHEPAFISRANTATAKAVAGAKKK